MLAVFTLPFDLMHRVRKPGTRPAQVKRARLQPVLTVCRFAVFEHLLQCGLPQVHDGPACQVAWIDLAGHAAPMHSARKRPSRPSDHPASAMPPPTKTIPAVSGQPTPVDHPRQPPNFTSVQADLPGPHKAPPPSRPSGPPATRPTRRPAARQRTARRGPRRRHRALQAAQLHRRPAGTAHPAARAASTFWQPDRILRLGQCFGSRLGRMSALSVHPH